MTKSPGLSTFLLLSLYTACATADESRLSEYLHALEPYGFSGVVLVARGDDILVHEALGYADLRTQEPNTLDTYFDYASIAKTFTGVATLLAEQQGDLATTDPLSQYIGPLPGDKSLATVHHLATHRAGLVIRGYEGLDGSSMQAYIDSIKAAPIESVPGAEYRYTNAGSSLLAAVLEIACGQTWQDFISKNLFGPAGMETVFNPQLPSSDVHVAVGYSGRAPEVESGVDTGFEWGSRGASGVFGRARDLFAWVNFALRGDGLPPAVRDKMLDESEREAYGWHTATTEDGRRIIHKGGDSVLCTSQILYFPEEALTVIWLVNDNRQRWRSVLNDALPKLARGETAKIPETVERLPTSL